MHRWKVSTVVVFKSERRSPRPMSSRKSRLRPHHSPHTWMFDQTPSTTNTSTTRSDPSSGCLHSSSPSETEKPKETDFPKRFGHTVLNLDLKVPIWEQSREHRVLRVLTQLIIFISILGGRIRENVLIFRFQIEITFFSYFTSIYSINKGQSQFFVFVFSECLLKKCHTTTRVL